MDHISFTSNTDDSIDKNGSSNKDVSPSNTAANIFNTCTTSKDKPSIDPHDDQSAGKNKKKKRSLLDDDFFSLAGSFDSKRKNKHKHKHKHVKVKDEEKDDISKADEVKKHLFDVQEMSRTNTNEDISGDLIDINSMKVNGSNDKVEEEEEEEEEIIVKSITPPQLDNEKIKNEIATRINSQYDKEDTPGIIDSDEEIDEELDELLKLRSNKSTSAMEQSPEVYNFDQEHEKKRKYVIRITSKLPSPDNQILEVDFGTKGLKTFEKILKAAVDYFKKSLATKLSPVYLFSYDPLLVSLVWVEGKTLIQPFFTPRTLRVPPPGDFNPLLEDIEKVAPTMIRFFLIPKEYSQTFMSIYPEFQSSNPVEIAPEPVEVPDENSSTSEDEEEVFPSIKQDISPEGNAEKPIEVDENDGLFVIALKGKDNKRVEVKVSLETKLKNLVTFYLKLKGLSEDTVDISHIKLIFDDEELNLDETVGDTELEEDFEIQVKL